MKITYLGTAAYEGWPGVFCGCESCEAARALGGRNIRTRSQAVIDDTALLIDFPSDTYMHALNNKLRLDKVTDLIVTHSHSDHFSPQDLATRKEPFAFLNGAMLNIYGNDKVEKSLDLALRAEGGSSDEFFIRYKRIEPFVPEKIGGYEVTALLARHDGNERCYIYIIGDGRSRILYANDTGLLPEDTWKYIAGIRFDLVSMDCTTGIEPDGGYHMGIADNVKLRDRLRDEKCIDDSSKLVVTHFSHNGRLHYDAMVPYAAQYGFETAYDGMSINF